MNTTEIPLSKWWQSVSCAKAYARHEAQKKAKAKKSLPTLLAWKKAEAARVAALDRQIWKDEVRS